MNKALLLALALTSTTAPADNYVNGYMKNDGTYVSPHYQTTPDRNPYNNYSTQGNTNPYTGQQGTRDPYQVQQQYQNTNRQPSYNSNPYGNKRRNDW